MVAGARLMRSTIAIMMEMSREGSRERNELFSGKRRGWKRHLFWRKALVVGDVFCIYIRISIYEIQLI